jgi:stress response protein SCP2
MAIVVTKGTGVDVRKGLNDVKVELEFTGADVDLEVFLLNAGAVCPTDDHIIFYNNVKSLDGSVVHQGDVQDGSEPERAQIFLTKLAKDLSQVVLTATIHDPKGLGLNFGKIQATLKVFDATTGIEEYRVSLNENFGKANAVEIANFTRKAVGSDAFSFNVTGRPTLNGISGLIEEFGLEVKK